MSIGKRHNVAVQLLQRLIPLVNSRSCSVQIQGPVTLPPFHEPEPDGAILGGSLSDYADRLPGPTDVRCVIEVADSSLLYDRTTKLAIYAAAGIPQYVIVNLVEGCLEAFEQPLPAERRYARSFALRPDDALSLDLGGGTRVDVPARTLLP